MLDTQRLNLAECSRDLEGSTATEIVSWALERFESRLSLACSFQAEGSVLIDLMHRVRGNDFRVFTLDTGRLNQETYDCMDAIRERYGVKIEVFFPEAGAVEKLVRENGMNLFYDSVDLRKSCCAARKVEPLSGLRVVGMGRRFSPER